MFYDEIRCFFSVFKSYSVRDKHLAGRTIKGKPIAKGEGGKNTPALPPSPKLNGSHNVIPSLFFTGPSGLNRSGIITCILIKCNCPHVLLIIDLI